MPELTTALRLTSASVMTVLSATGIVINTYVFKALTKRKQNLSLFYKLCISKTLCNLITCAAFLAWAAPCTFLDYYYMPYWINIFWGQLAGWGAYVCGMCIQICPSLNRFTVTYFPFNSNGNNTSFNVRNCLLSLTLIFFLATVYGFPQGCGYMYSIEIVSWLSEDSECAMRHADQVFYFILVIAIVSNSSNLATFIKLMKKTGSSISTTKTRSKKSRLMFAQSVTQDCLHMVDMLACQVIYKFNDALWFQFICMSAVWLTIHVFDGFVMLVYNRDIHPACLQKRRSVNKSRLAITSHVTSRIP